MRHFHHLAEADVDRLFEQRPVEFDRHSPREQLASALGATLYIPATRADLARTVTKRAHAGVTSIVICLEDSVPDAAVPEAEENLVRALRSLHHQGHRAPLLFVRIRQAAQLGELCRRLGEALEIVTGFVLPKFDRLTGEQYLHALIQAEIDHDRRLLCMPVLESRAIAFAEHRHATLQWVQQSLADNRDRVLAVRLGATDLCGLFGLRRKPDMTIYDVRVVSDILVDVLNYLGRSDDGFVVTGPVWEYFSGRERIFRPRLRQSIFEEHHADALRTQLLRRDMDGLIREVELDKANGILGKTVIHPSHVPIVHSLLVVSHEEHADARDIVAGEAGGGVAKSGYQNKMNESKPHLAWACSTLTRAEAFGVARQDVTFVDVLTTAVMT